MLKSLGIVFFPLQFLPHSAKNQMKVWVRCPSLRCLRFLEPKGQLNPIKPLNHGLDNLSMSKCSLKKTSIQVVSWGLVAGKMAASVVRVWPMKRPTCPWCWILTGGTLRMVNLGIWAWVSATAAWSIDVDCTWGESTNMFGTTSNWYWYSRWSHLK